MMKLDTILVGHDFSTEGAFAVQNAIRFARGVGAKRVHIVHVVEQSIARTPYPSGFTPSDAERIAALQTESAHQKLETFSADDLEITRDVRVGIPSRDLVTAAHDVKADIVVVATHGRGALARAVYGSVAAELLKTTPVPLLVVGEGRGHVRFDSVVAGVDFSEVSRRIAEIALRVTAADGRLEVITTYEQPLLISDDERLLPRVPSAAEREAIREKHEASIARLIPPTDGAATVAITALDKAPPGNAILEVAELLGAGLIVIGISGHNAWHRAFVGSTTTRVLSNARCPVLLVPIANRPL